MDVWIKYYNCISLIPNYPLPVIFYSIYYLSFTNRSIAVKFNIPVSLSPVPTIPRLFPNPLTRGFLVKFAILTQNCYTADNRRYVRPVRALDAFHPPMDHIAFRHECFMKGLVTRVPARKSLRTGPQVRPRDAAAALIKFLNVRAAVAYFMKARTAPHRSRAVGRQLFSSFIR